MEKLDLTRWPIQLKTGMWCDKKKEEEGRGEKEKRRKAGKRERGRERGRERENVKWKSAIAVIYQSGVRPRQRTSKWECHGNVRRPASGTRSRCPPLGSLPRSILRCERHRSNKGEEVPHPLLLRRRRLLLLLLLWCYGNNKGLRTLSRAMLWKQVQNSALFYYGVGGWWEFFSELFIQWMIFSSRPMIKSTTVLKSAPSSASFRIKH